MIRFQKLILMILTGIFLSNISFAISTLTALKQVNVKENGEIDISFSGKVDLAQTQIDYFNDTIQISLNGVSVYPAKMATFNSGIVTKIFAYQYSPQLVRCRFTIKGHAEDYKNRFQVKSIGKSLRVQIDSPKPQISNSEVELDEKKLMDRVLKVSNEPTTASQPLAVAPEKSEKIEKLEKTEITEKSQIATGKPLPSLMSVFLKLGGVVFLFGIIALFFRKFKIPQNLADSSDNGIFKHIKKLASQGFKPDAKMIQIVSTQYLGPKKSIVVARVSGRLLVLGVSSDSIQLITQFSDDKSSQNDESKLDDFSDLLSEEEDLKNKEDGDSEKPQPLAPVVGVRSRIKNRLEGLKPL